MKSIVEKNLPSKYQVMLESIDETLPAAVEQMAVFRKSHSQFMSVTVDVACMTPIRSLKHLLAEIERTRSALHEASFKQRKSDIKRQRILKKIEKTTETLKRDLLQNKADELAFKIEQTEQSALGAVKKITGLLAQYQNLLTSLGKTEITEQDFEEDEARYHIMTAMRQALNAARATPNGQIDHGNHIYLFDIGISGAQAQLEVSSYLRQECELIENGKAPTHAMQMRWLEALADKWKDEPRKWAESKGFTLYDVTALHNGNEGE